MKSAPLFADAAAYEGANLEVIVCHDDLTQVTAATAQTLQLLKLTALYMMVELVRMELLEAFEDTADAANNTAAITVGDGASASRFLASAELNKNGTTVFIKAGTGTKYVYAADDTVDVVFGAPPSGKNLAALNKGKLRLLFRVHDARDAK